MSGGSNHVMLNPAFFLKSVRVGYDHDVLMCTVRYSSIACFPSSLARLRSLRRESDGDCRRASSID